MLLRMLPTEMRMRSLRMLSESLRTLQALSRQTGPRMIYGDARIRDR